MAALLSGGEVISLHVGGCGGNVAAAFWQLISKEHHLVTSYHVEEAERNLRRQERKSEKKAEHGKKSRFQRNDSRYRFIQEHLREDTYSPERQRRRTTKVCTPPTFNRYEPDRTAMSQNLHVFFQETLQRYVPRAIFIDQDPAARYSGLFEPSSPLKHFFRPENFVFGREGSKGIYSGTMTEHNSQLLRRAQETISGEMEKADAVQGFQITHHLGGGSGSGITSTLLTLLHDEMGLRVPVCPVSFLPTITDVGAHHHAVDIYNTMLTLPDLANLTDVTFFVDNEALYDICLRLIAVHEPGWRDLNHIVASTLANFTSCMRFPHCHSGVHYSNASRLHFKDFPSLLCPRHIQSAPFVIPGFSPFTNRAANAPLGALLRSSLDDASDDSSVDSTRSPALRYRRVGTRMPTVAELCQTLFRPAHLLASMDPLGQHYLSSVAVFRGQFSPGGIEQEVNYARLHGPERYQDWSQWMPRKLVCKICPEPAVNLRLSAAWAGSSTGIGLMLEPLIKQYRRMLDKRVFMHVFTSAGIEEAELFQKLDQVQTLITHYDVGFQHEHERQIEFYEAKRDLGDIPFDWNVTGLPETVFNKHKTVQLEW